VVVVVDTKGLCGVSTDRAAVLLLLLLLPLLLLVEKVDDR